MPPLARGATRLATAMPIVIAAAVSGTTSRQLPSAHSLPIHLACTIRTAMFGSGSRIAATKITKAHPGVTRRRWRMLTAQRARHDRSQQFGFDLRNPWKARYCDARVPHHPSKIRNPSRAVSGSFLCGQNPSRTSLFRSSFSHLQGLPAVSVVPSLTLSRCPHLQPAAFANTCSPMLAHRDGH